MDLYHLQMQANIQEQTHQTSLDQDLTGKTDFDLNDVQEANNLRRTLESELHMLVQNKEDATKELKHLINNPIFYYQPHWPNYQETEKRLTKQIESLDNQIATNMLNTADVTDEILKIQNRAFLAAAATAQLPNISSSPSV